SEFQHGVGGRRARAPGADLHDVGARRIGKAAPETFGKSCRVGVEAKSLSISEAHGIHSSDGARVLAQLVQQRNHSLLARVSYVDAGKTHSFGALEQGRQRIHAEPQDVEVDQAVEAAN